MGRVKMGGGKSDVGCTPESDASWSFGGKKSFREKKSGKKMRTSGEIEGIYFPDRSTVFVDYGVVIY